MKKYTITHIHRVDSATLCVTLQPDDGEALQFNAGQYVQAAFEADTVPFEFHPFSLISSPEDRCIRLVIKALGDHTRELLSLKPGDSAHITGPYGTFSSANIPEQKQVWVAAGIAIAPFLSMAEALHSQHTQVRIYHFVRTKDDALGLARLRQLSSRLGLNRLQVSVHIGGYDEKILRQILADNQDCGVLVCGGARLRRQAQQVVRESNHACTILFDDFVAEPVAGAA